MSIALNCVRVEIPVAEPINKKRRGLEPFLDQEGPFGFLLEKQGSSYRKRSHSEGCPAANLPLSESREKWLADIKNYAVIEGEKEEEKKISSLFSKKLKV